MRLADGRALCDACSADLPQLREPFCQACGEVFQGIIERPFSCPNCQDLKFAFSFARPAMLRDPGTLDLIHRLKYGRQVHLAGELGRLVLAAFEDPRLAPMLAGRWPLVPVPLHRSRLRDRHFNQAEEISRALSRLTAMPVLNALERTRGTSTQTLLNRRQRMENLRGAFALTRAGEKYLATDASGVVLVDDVLTTGSTVHECAQTLRSAGFNDVCVVTVMRG
jgi:ComF family protein